MEHKYLKYKEKYLSLKKQMGGMLPYLSSSQFLENTIPDVDNPFALFNVNEHPIYYDISKNPTKKIAGLNKGIFYTEENSNPIFPRFGEYQFNWNAVKTTYNLEAFPTNTFTSNVLAMVLGLNYDRDALQTFIRHKRVILFDFANIVWKIFNLLDRILGGDKNTKVREKEKIKFITNTFKNFFNDNDSSFIKSPFL